MYLQSTVFHFNVNCIRFHKVIFDGEHPLLHVWKYDYYSILDGKEPSFFSLDKLFPFIEIDNNDVDKISKQKNYKKVDLQELIDKKIQNPFIVMVNSDTPILITTNKFNNNKEYISSEIKFFSKKN